jgi:glycosyltransferase involved in cell wall biosynthesis
MNGEISVIIPAYNREELIGETLWSLLSQTVPAKEIIVVDDGSQDGTGEAVLEMLKLENTEKLKISRGRPWPELRVIRQENAGPGAARNRGLAASTGEFIHFFDSDDIAAPNKHEVQLRALQESGADIAYGAWVKGRFVEDERHFSGKVGRWESGKVEVNGGELSVAGEATGGSGVSVNRSFGESGLKHGNTGQPKHWFKPVGPVLQATGLPDEDLIKALLTDWSIVPHACLFRRSILERSGGFPEDIWVGEDHLMFLRCLLAGAKVVHAPGTLTYYRVGGGGKLTSVGEAQKRHARDWGRFLLKAKNEVTSDEWRVTSGATGGGEVASGEWRVAGSERRTQVGGQPERSVDSVRRSRGQRPDARGQRPEDRDRTSETGEKLVTRDSLPVTKAPKDPSSWFGFRLRVYEAWKDLQKFFPDTEEELKAQLSKVGRFEGSKVARWKYEVAGWLVRKVAGLKAKLTGSRARGSFRAAEYGAKEKELFVSAAAPVPR